MDNQNNILLYPYGNQIILKNKNNLPFTQPFIIAIDYANSLSYVQFRGQIIYAYMNTENHLIVKTVLEPATLLSKESNEDYKYTAPHLLLLDEELFLFFKQTNIQKKESYIAYCKPQKDSNELFFSNASELKNMDELLQKKDSEITQLKNLLHRASTQYSELMEVATRYREEAEKWHKKFISGS